MSRRRLRDLHAFKWLSPGDHYRDFLRPGRYSVFGPGLEGLFGTDHNRELVDCPMAGCDRSAFLVFHQGDLGVAIFGYEIAAPGETIGITPAFRIAGKFLRLRGLVAILPL